MKSYSVLLTQTAEKELSRLPNKEIKKIVEILKFLEENPRPIGAQVTFAPQDAFNH